MHKLIVVVFMIRKNTIMLKVLYFAIIASSWYREQGWGTVEWSDWGRWGDLGQIIKILF